MKVEKKELLNSQIELRVEITPEEFSPFLKQGAKQLAREIKIDGFRPGHAPYHIIKAKVGEMTIMEEAINLALKQNLHNILKSNVERNIIGEPQIEIIKLAPDNPVEFKIILSVLPEIKLGNYKNLNIKEKKAEVKEQDIEKILKDLQEYRAQETIVDRQVLENDKVLVDINMYLDNVPVDGGQGKDVAIIIGKGYIIPGFDKNLIGSRKGETREFSLLYPPDHYMKNIAGKMVDFKVKIKEVYSRTLPSLDKALAQSFGLGSLDELKENIKRNLNAQITQENTQIAEREIIEEIIKGSRFGDIPKLLIEQEVNTMIAELKHSIEHQGGKFSDYLTSIGKTSDQLTLDLLPEAVKRVKASLLIREIAKIENVKVDDKEIEKYIQEMKKHYRGKPEIIEKVNTEGFADYVYNVLVSRKVMDKLREWNITSS